jgi:hypothetical protein
MNAEEAKKIVDKIVGQVFGYQNPLSLEQFMQKFAFDIRLPQQVYDSTDNSVTWAQSTNPTKFMKLENARTNETGIRPSRPMNSLQDILAAWNEINYTTTEKQNESVNVAESDSVDRSQNVFRSQDIRDAKNIVFSDGVHHSEFVAASQRSGNVTFGIRIEDSGEVSNSFGVSWSGKVTNCLFIHDCGDMQDSMFCTNMYGGRYCIANMQFEEEQYKKLREEVIRWILSPQG